MRSSFTPLLVAMLVLVSATVWLKTARAPAPEQHAAPVAKAAQSQGSGSADGRGPSPLASTLEGGREFALTANESTATSANSTDAAWVVPDDAHWVEGRVVLPAGTPADECVVVVASGKSFAGRAGQGSDRQAVALPADGRFRIAFAKGTRVGSVELQANYVYLPGGEQRVRVSTASAELVLKPKLGGRLLARLALPPELEVRGLSSPGAGAASWWSGLEASIGFGPVSSPIAESAGVREYARGGLPLERRYQVKVVSPNFAEVFEDGIRLEAGRTTAIELTLELGVRFTGRVVDKQGAGIAGASLGFRSNGNRRTYRKRAESDADGFFDLHGVSRGRINVEVRARDYSLLSETLGVFSNGDVQLDLTFQLDSGGVINGLVTWPDGRPAMRADVFAVSATSETLRVRTDERGAFRLGGLTDDEPWDICISARPPRGFRERGLERWRACGLSVRPGAATIEFVMGLGARVRGVVVDDRGQAVTEFRINAETRSANGLPVARGKVGERFQADDGAFELVGLMDGRWELVAKTMSGGRSEPEHITIPFDGAPLVFVVARTRAHLWRRARRRGPSPKRCDGELRGRRRA